MKMIKENKVTFILTSILTLLPLFIGLIFWNKLPDQIATHFLFDGTPDRYSSKAFVVFVIGAYMFVIHMILSLVTAFGSNKYGNMGKIPFRVCLWICPIVAIFVSAIMYTYAAGVHIDVAFCGMLFAAVLFLILGNYMPKTKQNHFMGTRVKWTLESKKNWAHTHRFTGWVMIACGVIFLILAFTEGFRSAGNIFGPVIFICIILVFAFASVLYSYLYYKNHKGDEDYYE